ncbi:MAG: acyl-CoA dehydratase activase, partial [Planctomycetota bacterium]
MTAAYLGIDVGSLYVGLVLLDGKGSVVRKAYRRHQGEPVFVLLEELERLPLETVRAAVRTGSGARELSLEGEYIDAIVAQIEGVRLLVPDARNILSIGGGSFSLTRLDAKGQYRRCTVNSACASGTGAFLDQQALRLEIPPQELADRAMGYGGIVPAVATRCAVFAKSDMIHLQQEGYGTDAIAAGLCAGLGRSTVDGLLGGHGLQGKTAVIGGVALNRVVVVAVREKLGCETVVPEDPQLAAALGAALYARSRGATRPVRLEALRVEPGAGRERAGFLRPPLELRLSEYPAFRYHDYYRDEHDSEVALLEERTGRIPVLLGIDIGSTSTKAALLDPDRRMVAWVYRKTAGDPIGAVQKVFRALRDLARRAGIRWDVRGAGTTGSGRKMVRAVIGADLALNEITAHARAAVFLDPEVDTILELGGQDAKFTQLQDGVVYNSVMNYVCAAGTGSFIEEQAVKLGLPIEAYADFALGVECPMTSDRCTVYMERDLDLLLARGWSKRAVAASVLHSVRDNYLNKVVGGLYLGNHVCFQGATARNRALVAAFEAELGLPIRVSPYCHITGALGMCLLLLERFQGPTAFRGLEFADERVVVEHETCELCRNRCGLSLIRTSGPTVAWGLKCGRDYESRRPLERRAPGFEYLRRREHAWRHGPDGRPDRPRPAAPAANRPRVGIPRMLGTYGTFPLWRTFFETLGCDPVLSPPSSEAILRAGTALATAEYCAPVFMAFGHAAHLLEKGGVDYLFVPHMVRADNPHGFTDAHFCCYLQAHPGVLRSLEGLDLSGRLLAPVVQLQKSVDYMTDRLEETVGAALGKSREEIRSAYVASRRALSVFEAEALPRGAEGLEAVERAGALGIVLVGRPYNTLDAGMALDLPRKIAEMGYTVLFLDQLPLDFRPVLEGGHRNMYWHYGQKILAAAEYIARHDRLFGVFFTNFMCGPDSYILTYFKEIMARARKPYIVLQFDGHGADAGYLTRIEAALESFHAWKGVPRPEATPAPQASP